MFTTLRASARLRAHHPLAAAPTLTRLRARPPILLAARTFADDADESKLRKPKASTPLRRTAAASLPIRANPTPTRSTIQPVVTLTTASRYVLPRLRAHLPPDARVLQEAWWVPRWRPPTAGGHDAADGEVFVFGNGSIVCWGLTEADARAFAAQVLARSNAAVEPLHEPETEDLEFVTDPSEQTRLQGDLIILGQTRAPESETSLPAGLPPSTLPQDSLLARYAYSQALSRSTALSALETSLEAYLQSTAALPDSLIRTGKPGLGRVALVKKLGELLKFRQGLNLNRENFSDTPDFYWAEPGLEKYFNTLSNALEMQARTRSVNDKITYAAEMQSVLRQLLTETSAHRMELIIIILIAVEVVICLIRDGPELWHMMKDEKPKQAAAELEKA